MIRYEEIFRNKQPDDAKLKEYGFLPVGNRLVLKKEILDGQFELQVEVGKEVSASLTDSFTGEPYTLYLVEEAAGAFVGSVRSAVEKSLAEIAARCFGMRAYGECTAAVRQYVKEKYGDELEYLWKNSENAVWRRKDNAKWYGAVLIVSARKFGRQTDKPVEILDFRMNPEELDAAADGVKIFRGYHMNKRHWATVLLDGSVSEKEIFAFIDESYRLAK